MRRVRCLILLLLFASAAIAARTNRAVLVTTDRGQFYLHGALVPPPYEVSVSFRLAGADTIWDGIYINDLPLWHPPAVQKQAPSARDSLWNTRWAAVREATQRASIPPGPPSIERTRQIVAVYASLDTMVDSARAVSAGLFLVYWHGETGSMYPLHGVIEDASRPTPAQASRSFLDLEKRVYGGALASGCVILDAGQMIIPRSRVAEFQRELAMLRRGDPGPYVILRHPQIREELLHPLPLPAPER